MLLTAVVCDLAKFLQIYGPDIFANIDITIHYKLAVKSIFCQFAC